MARHQLGLRRQHRAGRLEMKSDALRRRHGFNRAYAFNARLEFRSFEALKALECQAWLQVGPRRLLHVRPGLCLALRAQDASHARPAAGGRSARSIHTWQGGPQRLEASWPSKVAVASYICGAL